VVGDKPAISIKAKRRIEKFNEGQNPETDQPFEVIEKEEVFTGEEAEWIMKELGIKEG
jgi:hypothetical protein